MRVVFDLTPIAVHQDRGIGVYAQNLARALGSKVTTFTGPVPDNCDLVHFTGFSLFRPDRRYLTQKPMVVTVHDLIPLKFPDHYPPGLKGTINWLGQKLILKRARTIITDSKASKADIAYFTGIDTQRIKVIYLAPDPAFKVSKPKKVPGLPAKFVFYVGDVNYNKNLPRLLEVCLELKYPLVLAGPKFTQSDFDHNHPENRDRVKVEQLAQIHPREIIRLGKLTKPELINLYNLATVLALPSLAEGFGLPVLEAMACGIPVVTSLGTATKEIVGRAALLINPENSRELASALKSIWTNLPLRLELKQLGLKQVKQFTWEKTAKATMKVYEAVV